MEIGFKDFRGFHDQRPVRIAPITMLVGENSAGKTSFLAGLKYLLDLLDRHADASFNKEPFQLGTFQQIAHHRGGRAGRARKVQIDFLANFNVGRRRRLSTSNLVDARISLVLSSSESLANITQITIISDNIRLLVDRRGGKTELSLNIDDTLTVPIDDSVSRFFETRGDLAVTFAFLLREIHFSIYHFFEERREGFTEEQAQRLTQFSELVDGIATQGTFSGIATAPIRFRPLRVYTPGTEVEDSEGSHVPFELAKLARARDKAQWERLKDELEQFGKRADLFKSIDLKSFGTTSSDPFQIQFSNDGPKANIVDLGYGVSQVLPLLYEIVSGARESWYLIQQPEVHLHPKAQAALGQFFVERSISAKQNFVLETHSDFILDRARIAVREGKLDPSDVSILYFERDRLENRITQIELDDAGSPISPPASYRDFFIGEQMRNIGI